MSSSCGRNGIVLVQLDDPFSLLLRRLSGEQTSAVGFYSDGKVALFRLFDARPVDFLPPGISLLSLPRAPWVERVAAYPFVGDQDSFRERGEKVLSSFSPQKESKRLYKGLLLDSLGGSERVQEGKKGYDLLDQVLGGRGRGGVLNRENLVGPLVLEGEKEARRPEKIPPSSRESAVVLSAAFIDLLNDPSFRSRLLQVPSPRPPAPPPPSLSGNLGPPLSDLRSQIGKLGNDLLATGHASLDLSALRASYNRLAEIAQAPMLDPLSLSDSSYPATVLVGPPLHLKSPRAEILLPLRGANLSSLSLEQLKESLLYLDALAVSDNRCSALQNDILRELALRP